MNPVLENDNQQLKNFYAGIAMATPFYAEFFPWIWSVSLSLPFFLLLMLDKKEWRVPDLAVIPMLILLLLHLVALGLTSSSFEQNIIKDVLIGIWVLAIYFLSSDDIVDGLFLALIPLGIISAVMGLFKAALLDRGYLIGPLLNSCEFYPAGSALCINYNNLGFVWLVAILGCMKRKWWILIPILVAAGALSGSRRFLLLVPFLFVFFVIAYGREFFRNVVYLVFASLALIYIVHDPESFERFRFGDESYTIILHNWGGVDQVSNDQVSNDQVSNDQVSNFVQINRSTPSAMLGTVADGTLGTASRLDFWKLGLAEAGWFPRGWAYHETFSCAFSSCHEFHYPHLSILSEWIIGGVVFGLVALMFYFWPAWSIWRNKSLWGLILIIVAMPYSLISGDTVFSHPLYLACMLAALSAVPRKSLFSNKKA